MSSIDEQIKKIKNQFVGETRVTVLLVEGTDDVDAFRILLDRRSAGWEKKWLLTHAGKKDAVIKMLAKEPSWQGIVDRDEWTDEEVEQHQTALPNLFLLPRFCLESYLIDPNELWQALPEKQRNKLANGYDTLETAIKQPLPNWLRHAALWHSINPLWQKMMSLGFTNEVLDPQNVPDDDALLERLKSWQDVVNTRAALSKVQQLQSIIQTSPHEEQFSRWIHAKRFYPLVVHQTLNQLLGQRSEKIRRADLFRTLPLPVDLEPLWQKMGLVTP